MPKKNPATVEVAGFFVAGTRKALGDGGGLEHDIRMNDFRADAFVRKDFQEQGMRRATVDKVHAANAALKCAHGGIYFRNHSRGNNAGFFQK